MLDKNDSKTLKKTKTKTKQKTNEYVNGRMNILQGEKKQADKEYQKQNTNAVEFTQRKIYNGFQSRSSVETYIWISASSNSNIQQLMQAGPQLHLGESRQLDVTTSAQSITQSYSCVIEL